MRVARLQVHSAFTRSVGANREMERRGERRIARADLREERQAAGWPRSAGGRLRRGESEGLVAHGVSAARARVAGKVAGETPGGMTREVAGEVAGEAAGEVESDDDDDDESEEDDEDFKDDEDLFNQRLSAVQRERARRLRMALSDTPAIELRSRWREAREAGDREAASKARKLARKASSKEGAAYTYFTAHAQGKSAVRLRAGPGAPSTSPVPRAGIHRWSRLRGRTHSCEGAGAPVVLHYANANYGYWVSKYEMLTTKVNFGEGRQISLKTLPKLSASLEVLLSNKERLKARAKAKAAGLAQTVDEEDAELTAALGDVRKQGTTQGMHELAAGLVARGDLDVAKGLYRQQFVCADVLPELASHGLLVEIPHVRELLLQERGGDAALFAT